MADKICGMQTGYNYKCLQIGKFDMFVVDGV